MTEFSSDYQPEHDRAEAGRASGKSRRLSRALEVELSRQLEEGVDSRFVIARELARKAREGDLNAIREVFDRTEGKAAQSMELTATVAISHEDALKELD
jgi:serine/threonine protein kinase HipA of HipAB toxin-antitoxin module